MGEEHDAHCSGVSQPDERGRLEAVYAGYAQDPSKQRAWSAANPGNRAIREELVRTLWPLVPEDGVVLDVGCGTGWWLAALAGGGVAPARLAGADLMRARVNAARVRVPGADVRAADARALPFADGSAALVTLLTALSSMGAAADRRLALAEARRVLAPGGAVVVWEPRLPTGNAATARVSRGLMREELGPLAVRSLTLMPPLARRVSPAAYSRLARVPALRSHRLVVARPG